MKKFEVWAESGEALDEVVTNASRRTVSYRPYELADCIGCDCEDRDGRDVRVYAQVESRDDVTYDEVVADLKPLFLEEAKRLNVDPETFDWSEIDRHITDESLKGNMGLGDIVDSKTMENIAVLMDNDIREEVHREFAPCSNEVFLREYVKRDSEFADVLSRDFGVEI